MKMIEKAAGDLKVGDIMWGGSYYWTIAAIEPDSGIITFRLTWSGKGNSPYDNTNSWTTHSTYLVSIIDEERIARTCAPCRDSDCDCIFDGVG